MQRFDIYVNQNIELANSLIIKSDSIARAMNGQTVELGLVAPTDEYEWRYYSHLAGELYPGDPTVYLKSIDTGDQIELTLANLAIHKKTLNFYLKHSDYVRQLQLNNPEMHLYIKGCFYPIEKDIAIKAEDCTILYYDKTLLDKSELSVITNLEKWLKAVHFRWNAIGWKVHNDAFDVAFYGMLFPMIPAIIQRIRLENAHTPEVHNFHITEFLASHQKINEYIPYLNYEQRSNLYRNIRYYERNSGKYHIFDKLTEVLFTGSNMPVYNYSVQQQIHDDIQESNVTPNPIAVRNPINFLEESNANDVVLVETESVINKEVSLALNNSEYQDLYQTDLDTRLELTQYPNQKTKLLEVDAMDPEDTNRESLDLFLFNEWCYLTAKGNYNTFHEIINPTTGDKLKMPTVDVLALYLYSAFKYYSNFSLTTMPDYECYGVLITKWVYPDDLDNYLPETFPGRNDSIIQMFQDSATAIDENIKDNEEFYVLVNEILTQKERRYNYVENRTNATEYIVGRFAFQYYYRNFKCKFDFKYKSFKEFFDLYGYDVENISGDSWLDICIDAFNIGTGFENNTAITQTERQQMIIKLMKTLSSYTIQYTGDVKSDKKLVIGPVLPRIDDMLMSSSTSEVIMNTATVADVTGINNNALFTVKGWQPEKITYSVPTNIYGCIKFNPMIEFSITKSSDINLQQNILIESEIDALTTDPWLRVKDFKIPGFSKEQIIL